MGKVQENSEARFAISSSDTRIFIFLSFISVIGAGALLIGGMYLFGGFDEEIIYADNIAFSSTEVVSSEPFAMKITTATENWRNFPHYSKTS